MNKNMRDRSLIWFVLVVIISFTVEAEESLKSTDKMSEVGWYTVIGSNFLMPNKEYECAVTVNPTDISKPTTVTVTILEELNVYQNTTIASESAVMDPSTTKLFKLQVGELVANKYTLIVRSEGGIVFSGDEDLELLTKSASVFIQTDRAVYKPGAKVQFRVLVLDPTMKPTIDSKFDVYITDGDRNRIKEWRQISTKKGVWSGEIQLSDNPVLGDWTIHASVLGNEITKSIEVAEYILPKFEVSLKVPPNELIRDEEIPIQVSAKYTHGGAVRGEATVTAKESSKIVRKVVPIEGEATVAFNLFKELNLNRNNDMTIDFEVTVEEALTGKKGNSSGSTKLHKHEIKLELIKDSENFKPGLKRILYLKVSRYDGTPILDRTLPVIVNSRYNYFAADNWDDTSKGESYQIPESGLVKLIFYPPSINAPFIEIKVSYGDNNIESARLIPVRTISSYFIQVTLVTQHIQVNSEVKVELQMTEHSQRVYYLVTGREGVLIANSVSVNPGETTANFTFLATSTMAPKSKLLVYQLMKDKQIVADSVDLNIDYALPNFVRVVSNVSESEPGQGIRLSVESNPNSYVGLLGVDQSSILLKTGNDISKEDVINEFKSYMSEEYINPWYGWTKIVFEGAKTIVVTNGKMLEYPYSVRLSPTWRGFPRIGMWRGSSDISYFGPPRVEFARPYIHDSSNFLIKPDSPKLKTKLRSKFPETWIWKDFETNEEGEVFVNETVPDTITSWVISAFSLDSKHGLGLIDQPTKIRVFRPFFISLDLPYSIIRGETVTITVIVFNYMDTEVTADVTLLNNAGQFDFGDTTNSISDKPGEKELFKKERVTVQPNSGEKTSFSITATELGYISIKVSARSDIAADLVERKLLVKAEGETQFKNQAVLVDLRTGDYLEETVNIDLPDKFVEGSVRIETSAVGDILGTSLQNLESLIRMPFGCGEQNMLNFVPNILVLDYLKNSGQQTTTLESKCLKYMEAGYQRELTYKHDDGSFSAFGKSDSSGSTWLTAFVLKSFASAESHMDIDKSVIEHGLKWLARIQAPNGSFPEVGTVFHKGMQGGSGQGLALTSYSLLPFLAYNKSQYKSTIEKSLDYIVKQLDDIRNDSYSLAISTYVLHIADHPAKDTAFQMLDLNSHKTRSMKWWKRATKKTDTKNPNALDPNSEDVEMTSYAMLTYLERGLVEDTIKITSWLMTQQNSNGGFASTQDTVVALSALSKLAAKLVFKKSNLNVTFSTDHGFSRDVNINHDNAIVLQKIQVTGKADKVHVKAKGHGLAIAQVSYSYNVDETGAWPMFNIHPKVNNSINNQILIDICSSFVSGPEGDGDESSNMVVMEVSLPSGYTLDQDSLPSLKNSESVKKVELKEADTHIALYFDKMTHKEICPQIVASRSHTVEKSKPVPITVYDYYDQSRRARVFYSLPETSQQTA